MKEIANADRSRDRTEKFRELYESLNAEFVAVFGRQRVGKTHRVNEVPGENITSRYTGLSPVGEGAEDQNTVQKEQFEHYHQSLMMQRVKEN